MLQNDGCVCRTYVAKCEKSTVEKEHDAKQHEEPSKRREGNANLCRESVAWPFSMKNVWLCASDNHILRCVESRGRVNWGTMSCTCRWCVELRVRDVTERAPYLERCDLANFMTRAPIVVDDVDDVHSLVKISYVWSLSPISGETFAFLINIMVTPPNILGDKDQRIISSFRAWLFRLCLVTTHYWNSMHSV